ncbi:hypothetical protein D7V86_11725 [bacterium D16-51]|uniref:hypothetical protein n=1 Tax=Turicimonas muris TaxID=1796652 RepID=UPI000EA0DAF8|nr:hypothetical protein [Turicimonas muris]RKI40308.1 hypothetical protein D7V96_13580 [bacterium D16-59]RKI59683.1 hypothetical protein D7V86_11725 [bacterium D16-51]
MTKKQIDKIVEPFLAESRELGEMLTKEEIGQRVGEEYSKGQKERIFGRYRYLFLQGQNEDGVN